MNNKNLAIALLLILVTINLTSCAPSGYESGEAGFISGLWHGFIIVFSILGKLFGFDIGIGGFGGGGRGLFR